MRLLLLTALVATGPCALAECWHCMVWMDRRQMPKIVRDVISHYSLPGQTFMTTVGPGLPEDITVMT